jgi:GH15 family glucan-1,4-alpha-glucosidase
MSNLPIADYALLSDCRTAVLVSRHGSIDWLCCPRFDGPSVFGRLLDEDAGHWSITPPDAVTTTRRYLPETLVLETTHRTSTGTARVVDALAVGRNERGHELGADAPEVVMRRVVGVDGAVTFDVEFAPRCEYGLVHPLLDLVDEGVSTRGGADLFALSSPVPCTLDGATARARFTVGPGDEACFALHHRTSSQGPPSFWSPEEVKSRLDDTTEAWRTWSALHQNYEGPWRELVHLSGRVLYGLTYFPTGAICAAATTSLPETIGGTRNWDYRYAWVRDASFTMQALWVAACPDEADKFFDFMSGAAALQVRLGNELPIMFGVGGEHDLTERVLPHLRGWRDSAPVRVGNDAWRQRQLDVYGELLDATFRLPEQLDRMNATTKRFLADLADTAAERWKEKDQGIWEVRGEPRDFVYSKLMCWVALDRAIALADLLGTPDRVERWEQAREEVAQAILTNGWSDEAGAYTQSFGSTELDASNLMLVCVGFLPPDDPRARATIEATIERLTDEHGLLYRYLADDGLQGEEGAFLLCTFWLAQALAVCGDVERATEVFERAIAFVNDVGLLAEEVDGDRGELLGNFPQAFSHIGLVNAAWAISQASDRLRSTT